MIAVRLTPDVKMLAVASPDYLARTAMPARLPTCTGHACINWRFPGSGRIYRWEFEKKGKRLEVAVEGPLITNHQDVVVAAALQGLGILYAYDRRSHRQRRSPADGSRSVLADWSVTSPGLYLYYANRRHPRPALRAFIDCLVGRDDL